MKRVRVGNTYIFERNGLDLIDGNKLHPKNGTVVRVINLFGCPRANTMGQCYIQDMAENFLGMCSVSSLSKVK